VGISELILLFRSGFVPPRVTVILFAEYENCRLLTAFEHAPLADLALIWQLLFQTIAYLEHGSEFSNTNLYTVAIYYGVFTAVDLLAAVFGFSMERREKWSLTWWLVLQRFGYRQIMYYVLVRSISTALRGRFVGWSKLERTGTVKIGYARPA